VSPQYHVVYDDEFTTVPNAESGGLFDQLRPFDAEHWSRLVATGTERVIVDENDITPALHPDWLPPPPPIIPRVPAVAVPEGEAGNRLIHREPAPLEHLQPQPLLAPEGDNNLPNLIDFDPPVPEPDGLDPDLPPVDPALPIDQPPLNPNPVIQTRSGRTVRRPNRLIECSLTIHRHHHNFQTSLLQIPAARFVPVSTIGNS
jgi:hypothetical protein